MIENDRAIETDVADDLKPLKVVVEEDQTLTNISCIIVLPENHFELIEICNVLFSEKKYYKNGESARRSSSITTEKDYDSG